MAAPARIGRRDLLKRSGALVVGFSLAGCVSQTRPPATPAASSDPPTATPAPTRLTGAPPTAAPTGQRWRQAGAAGELDSC